MKTKTFFFTILILIGVALSPSISLAATPLAPAINTTGFGPNAYGCSTATDTAGRNLSYCMLAPLPIADKDGKIDPTGKLDVSMHFGDYLKGMIKLVMGLIMVFAVLMCVVGGIEYMSTVQVGEKEGAKSRILNALGGVVLALSSYLILNTINPKLVDLSVTAPQAVLTLGDTVDTKSVTSAQVQALTGKSILSAQQYSAQATALANRLGVPACGLLVTIARESRGNPGAIGPDENVASAGVPSRVAFITSGKKYSGATIPAGNGVTDKSIRNDDSHALVNGKLQLDGRFSYGIGLLQITLFPTSWNTGSYKTNPPDWATNKDTTLTRTLNGKTYTAEQLLDPDLNIQLGSELWASDYKMCGNDAEGAYRAYQGGSCSASSNFIDAEASARMALYNQCVAQGTIN